MILPIYIYDSNIGELTKNDMTLDEKAKVINECMNKKLLRSSSVFYETSGEDTKYTDYFESIEKTQIVSGDTLIDIALKKSEEIGIRTDEIYDAISEINKCEKGNFQLKETNEKTMDIGE